jgi:hypothetical protein
VIRPTGYRGSALGQQQLHVHVAVYRCHGHPMQNGIDKPISTFV